jgi:uncharacterized coiled-coil protein SlyX
MSADLRGSSRDAPATRDQPRPADQRPVPTATDQAAGAEARRQKYAHLTGGAGQAVHPDAPAPAAEQPRGADQQPVPPATGQAASADARRQKWAHLPERASPAPPRLDTPAGGEHVNGADRTGTHPYPEVPPQRSAEPGRPADSSDLPPGPAHDTAAGDRGPDDPPKPDGQDTPSGQETPAPGHGDNPGEAAGSDNAAKPAEASDRGEPQDSVVEADATEALKRRIAELETESAAKDAAIAQRDAALTEKDSTIASQWRKISELDYRVDDLAAENDSMKAEKAALDADKADPAAQNAEAAPGNADLAAEKAGLSVAPGASKAAPDAGQEQEDASPSDGADQDPVADRAGAGDEDQAGQRADIASRKAALQAREKEQPTAGRGWRRLVPSNELAGFIGGGGAGLGITIANVTHAMSDGWSAAAVAADGFVVSGVALVNKIWKKDSDGSQSQG